MHAYILLKKYCSTYSIQAYCLLKQQIRSTFFPQIFSTFPEISDPRIWLAFLRRQFSTIGTPSYERSDPLTRKLSWLWFTFNYVGYVNVKKWNKINKLNEIKALYILVISSILLWSKLSLLRSGGLSFLT